MQNEKNRNETPKKSCFFYNSFTILKARQITTTNIQLILEIKLKPLSDNTSVAYIHNIGPIDTPKLNTKVSNRESKNIV